MDYIALIATVPATWYCHSSIEFRRRTWLIVIRLDCYCNNSNRFSHYINWTQSCLSPSFTLISFYKFMIGGSISICATLFSSVMRCYFVITAAWACCWFCSYSCWAIKARIFSTTMTHIHLPSHFDGLCTVLSNYTVARLNLWLHAGRSRGTEHLTVLIGTRGGRKLSSAIQLQDWVNRRGNISTVTQLLNNYN